MKARQIIIITASLILGLALFSYFWDLNSDLKFYKKKSQDIERAYQLAEKNYKLAMNKLNEKNEIIANLNKRLEKKPKLVVKEIPADCQKCLKNYKMPVEVKDKKGWWIYKSPDIFTNPGELILTQKFQEDVINPYKTALKECQNSLKNKIKSPIKFINEVDIYLGYGFSGYQGQVFYQPLEFGGQNFSIGLAVWGGVFQYQYEAIFNAGAGIMIKIKK